MYISYVYVYVYVYVYINVYVCVYKYRCVCVYVIFKNFPWHKPCAKRYHTFSLSS